MVVVSSKQEIRREAAAIAARHYGAFVERELRSDNEIREIQRAIVSGNFANCTESPQGVITWAYEAGDAAALWELLIDCMMEAKDQGGLATKSLGLKLDPEVHYAEPFLAAGLILASTATAWLSADSEEEQWAGAHMTLYAFRCWDFWNEVRGPENCRHPDPRWDGIKSAKKNIKDQIFEFRRRVKNSADALDKKYERKRPLIEDLKQAWLSGKYRTKAECALKEHARAGMLYETAYGHLKSLPRHGK